MNGRPLTIPELGGDPTTHAGGAPAMLEAWYPGTTGGTAIAERSVRQVRPERQADDVVPPERRPDPDVVQRAPHRPAVRSEQQVHVEVPGRVELAGVPVRVRAVVHDVLDLERVGTVERVAERDDDGHRQGHEYGLGGGRRRRAALPPRERHGDPPACREARGVPAHHAPLAGTVADGHVHARPAEPRLLQQQRPVRGRAGDVRPVGRRQLDGATRARPRRSRSDEEFVD